MTNFPRMRAYWYIVCTMRQLGHRPLARSLLGTPLVIFRDGDGHPAALLDRCPHRNVPLSAGRRAGPHLACPYHGWQFDGQGVCRAVPGLCDFAEQPARNVPAYAATEQDGFVWVWAEPGVAPAAPPPRFPYLGAAGYISITGAASVEASLPDAAENFLDGTHTHFVHAGLIRTEGQRREVSAIVRRGADCVEAEYPDEGQQSGLISRLFGAQVDVMFGRFRLPSVVELEYRARGRVKLLMTLCFTPETDTRQSLFAVASGQAPRLLAGPAAVAIRLLFRQALRQDLRILQAQSANVWRFGGPQYVYTELDVLGPHILHLLKHGPAPVAEGAREKRLRMRL
jgi:phenylpropionate dioxygenase-like ring-hydroxylating dioxygenase large terminal subunit